MSNQKTAYKLVPSSWKVVDKFDTPIFKALDTGDSGYVEIFLEEEDTELTMTHDQANALIELIKLAMNKDTPC